MWHKANAVKYKCTFVINYKAVYWIKFENFAQYTWIKRGWLLSHYTTNWMH